MTLALWIAGAVVLAWILFRWKMASDFALWERERAEKWKDAAKKLGP